jgi:class 3 adenylate cyclase
MNRLMQSALSFLNQRFGVFPFVAAAGSVGGSSKSFVSGYSYPKSGGKRHCDSHALNHQQVGILYADIAAYSRLTEQDEEGTHHLLIESMKIMEAHVSAHNGRVVHTAGDAILTEFKDVQSALQCAVNVQLEAREMNARLPLNKRVLFRIGVNFGDVIADNGEIYGNAVNLAARLEKLASIGGVCVSESVRLKLEDNSTFNFIALGKQYVKNISEPVQAFWIEVDTQQVVDTDFTSSLKVSAMAS